MLQRLIIDILGMCSIDEIIFNNSCSDFIMKKNLVYISTKYFNLPKLEFWRMSDKISTALGTSLFKDLA